MTVWYMYNSTCPMSNTKVLAFVFLKVLAFVFLFKLAIINI